jgi:hypothetical protein
MTRHEFYAYPFFDLATRGAKSPSKIVLYSSSFDDVVTLENHFSFFLFFI